MLQFWNWSISLASVKHRNIDKVGLKCYFYQHRSTFVKHCEESEKISRIFTFSERTEFSLCRAAICATSPSFWLLRFAFKLASAASSSGLLIRPANLRYSTSWAKLSQAAARKAIRSLCVAEDETFGTSLCVLWFESGAFCGSCAGSNWVPWVSKTGFFSDWTVTWTLWSARDNFSGRRSHWVTWQVVTILGAGFWPSLFFSVLTPVSFLLPTAT